jgi:hypothetical protein
MMTQAAIAGLGVALLPRFLVRDELASDRLVVAARHELRTSSAYRLVYPMRMLIKANPAETVDLDGAPDPGRQMDYSPDEYIALERKAQASQWPQLRKGKAALPDADRWRNVPGKRAHLER